MSKILVFRRVKSHLKLANKVRCVFVKFNKISDKMTSTSKNKERTVVAFMILQFLVIIAKMWSVTGRVSSFTENILGIAIASLSTTAFLLRSYSPDYVQAQFLNYIFLSRDAKNDANRDKFLTYLVLFFYMVEFCYYSLPIVHWFSVMLLPCQPGLSSSILCSGDNGFQNGAIVKLVFAGLEFLVSMQSGVGGSYYIVIILLTGVTFLWKECGTFIKRYKSGTSSQIEYRKVLEKLLNACTREQIFSKAALLLPTFQIMTSFSAIKILHSGHDLIAVKVYGVSQKWITECKGADKEICARKFHRSLRPLRLEFGNNFVELLTPLVVQEFCLRQTAGPLRGPALCQNKKHEEKFGSKVDAADLEPPYADAFYAPPPPKNLISYSFNIATPRRAADAAEKSPKTGAAAAENLSASTSALDTKDKISKASSCKNVNILQEIHNWPAELVNYTSSVGNKFQCLFVKLDKTSDKITIISKRKERIVVAFTVLQFLVILAKIWSINARVTSLTENFLGIGILAISIAPFLLRCHTSADHVQLQFLNYLLLPKGDATTKNNGKPLPLLTYLILFIDMVEFSYYTVPTLHGLLVMLLPCQPGLISSISWNNGLQNLGTVKLFWAALEFLISLQCSIGGAYYLITVLLTGVTFLLIECGNFVKLHKLGIANQIEYRKVQVLEKLLNACTHKQIFLTAALIMPATQIIISFVAIKVLHLGHNWLAVALMWVYVMALGFTLLAFSAAAKLYGVSQKWITDCKGTEKNKCSRKFHRSLRPLRLEFGNNFVEVLTPLVVQEFCLNQTVSFLLATK
ncbi:hypothetical protein Fcan01_20722 [Folsomia candida]|uniref:Uncharacterized protein n=1 Tax=Folsomia candida TaxID=158441 RepID=A0A226DJF8_FOLCA|nr:hypothetical protein Fcan01_20722 [Folsomia candida]